MKPGSACPSRPETVRRNTFARRERGELNEDAFAAALAELDQRYDEMVARLDGSFRLPE